MLVSVKASAAYDLTTETFLLLMVEPTLEGLTHLAEARAQYPGAFPLSVLHVTG